MGRQGNAIKTTAERIAVDEPAIGGKALCDLLGYEVVRNLCKWLEVDGGNAIVPIAIDGCPTLSLSEVLYCYLENEAGDALLFRKLMNGNCLYDLEEKDWYLFDSVSDRYWKRDHGYARHFVTDQVAAAYDLAADFLSEKLESIEDEDAREAQEKFIANIKKRISSLKTLHRAASVLTLASGHKEIQIKHDQWNPDPYALCLKNGMLDMRTGKIRLGMPEDHQRFSCPTVWLGLNHPAPVWEQTLNVTFDGRTEAQRTDIIAFLQRFLGSGCVGAVLERRFGILFGERGQNGKDVLTSGASYALGGDIASPISKEVLLKQRTGDSKSASPDIADLEGKRLVWAAEPDQGERFDVGQVKWLTGGGKLKARRLYENGHTFTPSHTLLLLTNHKPHAPADDGAFWDRLFLIEFLMHFTTEDKIKDPNDRVADPHLEEKLKAEASGILAWLVRGCMEWLKVGFCPPAEVIASGEQYQKDEDTLLIFEEEVLGSADGATAGAQQLFDAYVAWCSRMRFRSTLSGVSFGKIMKTRHASVRGKKGIVYLNVRLAGGTVHAVIVDGKIHLTKR
jgi:putative DNA primase/helicase